MQRKGAMGRFATKIVVSNNQDVQTAKSGALSSDKIRSMAIEGIVDSGSANLVLPSAVVKQLGLNSVGQAFVRYADQRRAKRQVVEEVRLELLGRHGTFRAIVEPLRETALIGAIVLEDLDLVVDCTGQKLRPRDPRGIVSEIE